MMTLRDERHEQIKQGYYLFGESLLYVYSENNRWMAEHEDGRMFRLTNANYNCNGNNLIPARNISSISLIIASMFWKNAGYKTSLLRRNTTLHEIKRAIREAEIEKNLREIHA